MTAKTSAVTAEFDMSAAVTRSMLGWGVVAGPFYLVVGLVQALLAPGFDLAKHPLSALTLGDTGWIQTANLVLVGVMVSVAALGFGRAAARKWARRVSVPLGVYGLCMVASGIFRPDPVAGFPPGSAADEASTSGLLHLVFGALGFLALGVAAFMLAAWARSRGSHRVSTLSVVSGIVVIAGFAGGAALSTTIVGVPSLWLAVVCGFAWLAGASVYGWRTVPHPDIARR